MAEPIYKRIVLKISGEAIAGDKGFGIYFKYLFILQKYSLLGFNHKI